MREVPEVKRNSLRAEDGRFARGLPPTCSSVHVLFRRLLRSVVHQRWSQRIQSTLHMSVFQSNPSWSLEYHDHWFLLELQFVSRHGPVRQLQSDQGSNFIGAMNELQRAISEIDNNRIREELLTNNCDWVEFKVNVPHASYMGGVWERQIRSVRNVLASIPERHGTQHKVFDSATCCKGVSLKDMMLTGFKLQWDVLEILLRFWLRPVTLVVYIKYNSFPSGPC